MCVKRFNRLALAGALLWLAVTIPAGILYRPTVPDFEQFYLAGYLARHGEWEALYPVPYADSLDNAGLFRDSEAKERWSELCEQLKVRDYTHFMLPPPTALLFVPLSYFEPRQAFWVWTAFLTLCVWGVALVSGRVLRAVAGEPTRLEGWVALLVALSPVCTRAIRIANVTPPLALLCGLAVLSLFARRERPARTALSLLVAALLKYASLVLLPLLVALRRWRVLAWGILGASAVIVVTWALAGRGVFEEFFGVILPTLSRPSAYLGNQSLPGMFVRLFGRPLPLEAAILLNTLRLFALGVILIFISRVPLDAWRKPACIAAGATLLLSWLLVFSPIAWEHWPVLLAPFWGWLLWEARAGGWRRTVAVSALVLMYLPAGIFRVPGLFRSRLALSEPLNSFQLYGIVLMGLLAAWRVYQARVQAKAASSSEDAAFVPGDSSVARLVEAGKERDFTPPYRISSRR